MNRGRHRRWINYCIKLCQKSNVKDYKHAAVLVKGGNVISIGINKYKCGILADRIYGKKGWHSEADCLLSIHKSKIKNATLYVAGINKSQDVICSKPCPACQEFIENYNLKAIFYSDRDGNIVEYKKEEKAAV